MHSRDYETDSKGRAKSRVRGNDDLNSEKILTSKGRSRTRKSEV